MDPDKLLYAKTHEWVHLEGDLATVGITDFAVNALTDVVHIELPERGKSIAAGEGFGEIESVKAVSDLYAPMAGEIVETNTGLENDLSALSNDPFGKGWIVKIRVTDPSQTGALMDQQAYKEFCESEAH